MPQRGGGEKRDRDRQPGRKRPCAAGPIRKRGCYFCKEKVDEIDYKNANQLRLGNRNAGGALLRDLSGVKGVEGPSLLMQESMLEV